MTDIGKMQLAELKSRFHGGKEMPAVTVVDLRGSGKGRGWSPISETLKEKLKEALERKEQAIIFINRRGSASALVCMDCGEVVKCAHCDIPYTMHGFQEKSRLICHHCARMIMPVMKCEKCGGVRMWPVGSGTEKIEEDLKKMFPEAKILRADRDTTTRKEAHDEIYEKMQRGEADILVGTQIVAKGLDLPNVALVGIILADVGLHRPDFRAAERTFQLITQVAGRAGRREGRGEVILQTLSPDHYAIRAGVNQNFEEFYEEEIKRRNQSGWPPFASVVKLEIRGMDKKKIYDEAWKVAEKLRAIKKEEEILGPSPGLPPKVAGKYRFQILIIGEKARETVAKVELGEDWRVDVDAE